MKLAAAWAWLNSVLESNTFKLLILPVAGGIYAAGSYFGRRRIERTGESEEIKRVRELVDLQRAMNDGNVSVEDINNLRQQLLGKPVEQAVATATYSLSELSTCASSPPT
ncbi:hypothetical protein [Marilutibacter chinensis]|uniref:Uncharacterized protein n=1 Tax=Marilutibacter chinensis TaxID=2912247 RepID=A0ABS9HTH7_9GAMM|nr:hypothetical protein [Lysobacter chinensis]MCF7222209.1 hypothetical protein [Lysobacter chinensis]